MVLLKNDNNLLLPLDINKVKRILVTGPLADEKLYATSRYGPSHNKVTTVLQGIKRLCGR